MIAPDTPPGTEIICIDASDGPYGRVSLTLGAIYTVQRIENALYDRYVVFLVELPAEEVYEPPWGLVTIGFELGRFRYLDIPDALAGLLRQTEASEECV
jgi:hypothetical protein